MSQQITLDLHRDFANACAGELSAAGYTPPAGTPADVIRSYANVKHRRVEPRPRKVHKALYSVPAHLVSGEAAFLVKVASGADLRPYQSTRLERADFDDGMLNDFGIQHFHLGELPHPSRPGFVSRTEPVLFALVRPDDFFSLGCYAHGAWSQTALLDVIHVNWPHELDASNPSKGSAAPILGLATVPTDKDVELLRKNNINVLTQRLDGTIHLSPGGGITTLGGSAKVAREAAQVKSLCKQIESELRPLIDDLITKGKLVSPVAIRLEQQGSSTAAVVEGTTVRFDLNRQLSVPPL